LGSAERTPIVADPLTVIGNPLHRGPLFSLRLMNTGDEAIEVTGFSFDGLRAHVLDEDTGGLMPDLWRSLRFSARPDCFAGVPRTLPSVRLQLRTPAGSFERQVTLPEAGSAVVDYQHALCDARPVRSARELAGVWILEEAYGLFPEGEGVHLVRFKADGTLTADPEGLLLEDVQHGVEGTYALRGGRLIHRITGGYGCKKGDRTVWRPGILEGWEGQVGVAGRRLTMAWLGGHCPDDGAGEVWVLRKVLDGVDPGVQD
jgi:hypothetical protein